MTKKIIILYIIFLQAFSIKAQNNFYEVIKLGDYHIGFKDSIVFNQNYQYDAFDYLGMKPNFVQIWYPLEEKPVNLNYLKVQDFFEGPKTELLAAVQLQLKKHYQIAALKDGVEENLITGEANDFGYLSYEDILNGIGKIKTKSIVHSDFQLSQYPVIIYHHGSQSFPFENFVMAEYFASRGFIFVASNFHLPYENAIFGLKPYDKIIKDEDGQSLQFIVKFAKSLTNSKSVFFIGHSWGAQMGLRAFDNDTTIKGLISLETTLEFQTNQEKIKEMWPEVFQKVITEHANYPFPILFCAATGQEKPFVFFENINALRVVFAPTNKEFEHNAYVSSFYLRLFLNNKIKQTDRDILQDRLLLYYKHLELINEFIGGILKGEQKSNKEIKFVKND